MATVTHDSEPRKNDPAEEQECLDLLLRHKGTAIAATGWECYVRGGRSALLTNGVSTEYWPRDVIKQHSAIHSAIQQKLLLETDAYDPKQGIVLVILWSDRPWTIKRVVTDPDPETAFLQRV